MMRLGLSCFIRSALFSKLLNLKELSFFVVSKKKIYIYIKHEDSKSERRRRDQHFFKGIKHKYIIILHIRMNKK